MYRLIYYRSVWNQFHETAQSAIYGFGIGEKGANIGIKDDQTFGHSVNSLFKSAVNFVDDHGYSFSICRRMITAHAPGKVILRQQFVVN